MQNEQNDSLTQPANTQTTKTQGEADATRPTAQPASPTPQTVVSPPSPTSSAYVDPSLQPDLTEAKQIIDSIRTTFAKTIVGQTELLDSILVAMLSRGHILVEGVPGLAKTTAVRAVAASVGANFVRIQCTPDMLPSDILGTQIYNPQKHEFITQIGPINHQFVLVDEINRTGAKTQSALLEAMQERQLSIGGETHDLPTGFIVMATQNPIEQEGTYLLPEAQLDRFLVKHLMTYPTIEEELQIMRLHDSSGALVLPDAVADIEKLVSLQDVAKRIQIDDKVLTYIASVVAASRNPVQYNLSELAPYIQFGASPRASLALVSAGRAAALMSGSSFVTPDHIKPYLARVLRHRLGLTYEADAENVSADQIIERIGAGVVVP